MTKFLLDRGADITSVLTEIHYRRSPFVQGGEVEVPCLVKVEMHPIFKIIQLYWIVMKNWSKLFTVNLETHKSLFLFLAMRYLPYCSVQE